MLTALTIWQPHAGLVRLRIKRFETRGWGTSFRGPLAIHAGKTFDDEFWREACAGGWLDFDVNRPPPECVVRGAIVAVADVVDSRLMAWDDEEDAVSSHDPGKFVLDLQNVRPIEPVVTCRGQQGLWTVPPEVEAAVRAELWQEEKRHGG